MSRGEGGAFEAEGWRERKKGRSGAYFIGFMSIEALLLPFYSVVALFMVWVCYLVFNILSALALIQSATIPLVMLIGCRGALNANEGDLRGFAFMLLLAITMQLSAFVVVSLNLDDGKMSKEYLLSIARGLEGICEHKDDFFAALLPMDGVCRCGLNVSAVVGTAVVDSSSWADEKTSILDAGIDDMVNCMKHNFSVAVGIGANDLWILGTVTVLAELLLCRISWVMMVDLDEKEARRAQKKPGGPQTATLSGCILSGRDLQEGGGGKKKEKKQKKKKTAESARYVVLKLKTPDTALKEHRVQSTKTPSVDDDINPTFDHQFDDFVMYSGTRLIELEVFDKVKKHPVLIGRADIRLGGSTLLDYGIDLQGNDPDYDSTIVGAQKTVSIKLHVEYQDPKKKKQKKKKKKSQLEEDEEDACVSAGSIELSLGYAPVPSLGLKAGVSLTKSWYFEASVLGMCALSMLSLGISGPAAPKDGILAGAMLIIDVFIATHMLIELLLELVASGRPLLRNPWFQLAVFVLLCNWLTLLAPPEISEHAESAKLQRVISVGRVFRIVRPVRTLRMIKHVQLVVSVIADTKELFLTVCALLFFLLAIFGLVGMSSFGGVLQYECLEASGEKEYPKPTCDDGQQAMAASMEIECPLPCSANLACAADHFWCAPVPEKREVGHDRFGFRDFDSFSRAMVTQFVGITGDGGMHAITGALYEAGAGAQGTAWFINFCSSVCLSLIALNLFLAVCCSAYSEASDRMYTIDLQREKAMLLALAEERRNASPEEQRRMMGEEAAKRAKKIPIEEQILAKNWSAVGV